MLALVDEFSYGLADAAPVAAFYDDLMWDATRWGVPSQAVLIPAIKDTAEYRTPDVEGRIYGIFYDDVLLSLETPATLQAVDSAWRDARGRPRAFVTQEEGEHAFRLYPAPDEDSQDFIFLFGAPFGRDFPARAVGAIIGDRRDDLPEWLDLPLTLAILSREYEHDSAHRDAVFAQSCRTLGNALLGLVVTP